LKPSWYFNSLPLSTSRAMDSSFDILCHAKTRMMICRYFMIPTLTPAACPSLDRLDVWSALSALRMASVCQKSSNLALRRFLLVALKLPFNSTPQLRCAMSFVIILIPIILTVFFFTSTVLSSSMARVDIPLIAAQAICISLFAHFNAALATKVLLASCRAFASTDVASPF
jgi:hypothetical protein